MFTIQCDFDDTITVGDLGTSIVDAFGSQEWKVSETAYLNGRISVEETSRIQYGLARVSPQELVGFASQNVVVRDGFVEFVSFCRAKDISFVIVSSGLDLYIEPVLDMLGLSDIERYTAKGIYKNGSIEVLYIDPWGAPLEDGFKRTCMIYLRGRGRPIVYIGDSMSDIEPSKEADYTLARGRLGDQLQAAGAPFSPFETFYDVTHRVEDWIAMAREHWHRRA